MTHVLFVFHELDTSCSKEWVPVLDRPLNCAARMVQCEKQKCVIGSEGDFHTDMEATLCAFPYFAVSCTEAARSSTWGKRMPSRIVGRDHPSCTCIGPKVAWWPWHGWKTVNKVVVVSNCVCFSAFAFYNANCREGETQNMKDNRRIFRTFLAPCRRCPWLMLVGNQSPLSMTHVQQKHFQ